MIIDMPRRCPPGLICFPDTFSLVSWPSAILIGIIMIAVGLIVYSLHTRAHGDSYPMPMAMPMAMPMPIQVNTNVNGDDRYMRAPEAERVWNTGPDMSRIPSADRPFNIPTQGVPESYQSMGIVNTGDGKLLPLYGRRSIGSRERYNYYTRTDSYNPIPMPITIQGRDCQDQVGCPELYDGDRVKLSATDQTGEVKIYRVRDIVR